MDLEPRSILYRNLALAAGFLALIGWGTAYGLKTSAAVQRQLHAEVIQLKAGQEQLREERDQTRTQLAAAQQETAALAKRIGEMQVAAMAPVPASTGSVKSDPAKGKRR